MSKETELTAYKKALHIGSVRLSLDFAEWIDIYSIRDGEHECKYKGDNYTKKHSTQEMFNEWQRLLTNEA